MLGIAFGIASYDPQVLIEGTMVINDTYSDTPQMSNIQPGSPIYIRGNAVGLMYANAPGNPGEYSRVLGHAYYQSATTASYWIMKFRPSNDWVEI